MIEIIIGLGMGYFAGRIASAFAQPRFDRLLVWDKQVFAWRVVPHGSRLDVTQRYIAATDITLSDAEHMRRYNEDSSRY